MLRKSAPTAGCLSKIKLAVVPEGGRERKILAGAFEGLRMELDLAYQAQLYSGLFERELHRWLGTLSEGINIAIDMGTGEGEYSVYFLAKTTAKQVWAFEPSVSGRACLMRNAGINGFAEGSRLLLLAKAVGAANDENECTLDAFLPSISSPCLAKLDVDGAEVNVLRGSATLLRLPDIRWIIETHSRQLESECPAALGGAGLSTRIINHAWWRRFVPELVAMRT